MQFRLSYARAPFAFCGISLRFLDKPARVLAMLVVQASNSWTLATTIDTKHRIVASRTGKLE